MKKSILMILFLTVLLPAAFTKNKKTQKQHEIISITMHRTICYGRCPDYTVKVDRNGMVTYTGYMFVRDSGTYEKKIGTASAKSIIDMCETYRLDTCKDVYNNKIPDVPGLHYMIQYADTTKKITNASFGPDFLKEIAYSIDKISKVDSTWKHTPLPVHKVEKKKQEDR